MRPCTVPARTVRSTSQFACTSPKRLDRLRTSSSAAGLPTRPRARATASELIADPEADRDAGAGCLSTAYPRRYPDVYPCPETRSVMFRTLTAHVTLACLTCGTAYARAMATTRVLLVHGAATTSRVWGPLR